MIVEVVVDLVVDFDYLLLLILMRLVGVVMKSEYSSTKNLKDSNVVDFTEFRKKKEIADEIARGRNPLFVSHLTGKVTGSPHLKRPEASDFGDRLQRIRASLDKINKLMFELKKMSKDSENQHS